jgi:glutathione S-transferase
VRETYYLQGLGRHTLEEQKGFARRDLDAIARKVGHGPFLLGDELSVFEFGIAALLAGTIDHQPASWLTDVVHEFPSVVEYTERVQVAAGAHCREVV